MTNNEEVLSQEAADATASNHHEPTTDGAQPPSHGGGPTTAEGKLVSSQNARKHSFYAKKLFRGDEEGSAEHQQFMALLASLNAQLQPCGVLEQLLVERIAIESIRFGRLLQFEQEELTREFAFLKPGVDRILRYQASINKQLYQAAAQLERLQRQRLGDHVPAPLSVDLRIDAAGLDTTDRLEGQETIPAAMLGAFAPAARFLPASTTDECTAVEGLTSNEETTQ
jgi:hypothetical protein